MNKNEFLYSLINKNKSYYNEKKKKLMMLSKLRCNVDLIQELNKCHMYYVVRSISTIERSLFDILNVNLLNV